MATLPLPDTVPRAQPAPAVRPESPIAPAELAPRGWASPLAGVVTALLVFQGLTGPTDQGARGLLRPGLKAGPNAEKGP